MIPASTHHILSQTYNSNSTTNPSTQLAQQQSLTPYATYYRVQSNPIHTTNHPSINSLLPKLDRFSATSVAPDQSQSLPAQTQSKI
jgi:hypothetical protein